MIALVDSSVWIDLFRDRDTPQTRALKSITRDRGRLLVGDLVLAEVLQGARDDRDFTRTLSRLMMFDQTVVAGDEIPVKAAYFYRTLRARGITIRKTIDTLIATRCIIDEIPLLYSDRDFDPFVEHLGLRSALDPALGVN